MFSRGKLFITYPNNKPKFIVRPYRYKNTDYSHYLKKQNIMGFYQIPITSKDLIILMKKLFQKYHYILSHKGLECIYDASNYTLAINYEIKRNPLNQIKNGQKIIKKLMILYNKNDIELRQINMMNMKLNSIMYIKDNGIIFSDSEYFHKLTKIILRTLNND